MKKKQIKTIISALVIGVLAPLATFMPASAATVTWTGAGDGGFNSGLNWLSGGILVSGDTAVFPADSTYEYDSAVNRTANNDMSGLSLVKIIFNGAVELSSTSFNITGNGLTLTGGIDAVMTGNGGDHSIETDVTLDGDSTFKTTGSNTLAVGGESTILDLGTNDLTLAPNGGTITLMGSVKGSGDIISDGTGKSKLMIVPDETDGYDGALTISDGETTVDDNLGLDVTVNGGTLKGTGTVGNVDMSSGSVAPGNSPGVLNTGDLTYTGGVFEVELGGTDAGEFDQTNVTGAVDLGKKTTLDISRVNGFKPKVNDSFVIIKNNGNYKVDGVFKNVADGEKVTVGGYIYQVNYDGGSGNDVIVLVTAVPEAPDTGIGSIIRSPFATLFAALAVLGVVGAVRYHELKKVKS